jgi:3-oxoacyl-[acyl-carrier-protein] synthase II
MTGHLLGAAGAVEAIVCALTIRDGIIPPTINLEVPDPDCDLNYVPNTAVKKDVKIALSNTFGFGGHNASLLFRKVDGA